MVLGNRLGIHCLAISESSTIKTQWRIHDFPERCANSRGVRQPIILQISCRKLHKNEGMKPILIMWVQGVGVGQCEHSLGNGSFTLIEC